MTSHPPADSHGTSGVECWECAWEATRSLSDQAACMVAWLHGRHLAHPGHFGPPAAETAPLVGHLTALCGTGVVPTNSQPGIGEGRVRQRAYLTGYGPRRLVQHVVATVDRAPSMRAQAWPTTWDGPDPSRPLTVTMIDGQAATAVGTFGLRDELAGLVGVSLSLDAEAALEGSWSFWLLDLEWGRVDDLCRAAAEAAGQWVVDQASEEWAHHTGPGDQPE